MNAKAANEYLKAKVLTATAEQLQMLLYDGAIRFCEKAAAGLEQKQYDVSYSALSRAQKILLELHGSLKHNVAPELCANLASAVGQADSLAGWATRIRTAARR